MNGLPVAGRRHPPIFVADEGSSRGEFVRASQLGPQAQREGYWMSLAERAPKGDACEVCGADGDEHDVRRVYLPDRTDAERVPLCASCRGLWGDAL